MKLWLTLISFAVFGQTLWFGFVPYDDPALITGNEYVSGGLSMEGVRWAFTYHDSGRELAHEGATNLWHPLTWLSHQFDVTLFGLEGAWGHHLHNVVLHTLAGWLLFGLARQLGFTALNAFFIAAFFLVHPLHVESVAWLSARKDVLSGVFFFAALWAGLGERRWTGLLLFGAAIAAKPSVVVLPALLVLLQGWRAGERGWGPRFWWAGVRAWWPWFLLAAAGSVAAVWFQSQGSHAPDMAALPLDQRLLTMASGLGFLFLRSLFPIHLSFHYPYPEYGTFIHLFHWGILAAVAGILWFNRKHWVGLFVAVLWFLICWLPTSGLLYVGTSFTHDRYAYLALTGGFAWMVQVLDRTRSTRILRIGLLSVAVLAAFYQTRVWKDGESLFESAYANQPQDSVAMVNLASVYQRAGRHDAALALFEAVLDQHPQHRIALFNRGNSLQAKELWQGAEASFRAAVAVDEEFSSAWRNLGLVLSESRNPQRNLPDARAAFLSAWESSGERDAIALYLLIRTEFQLGLTESARSRLPQLRALNPKEPTIQRHLEQWSY